MLESLFHLPKDETEPLPIGEWFYALTVAPSQCYYRIQHEGVDYMLYLRWRHEDPWHAYVIKNAASLEAMNKGNPAWSEDVFELYQVWYTKDELEMAKQKVVSLFLDFISKFTE
jgi:hypothetical protein